MFLPVLFFLFIIILPCGTMWYILNVLHPEIFLSLAQMSWLAIGVAIFYGWFFRTRVIDREYIVSVFSFEYYPLIGIASGLSTLAGCLIPDWYILPLVLGGALLTIVALREGPVYGWDS